VKAQIASLAIEKVGTDDILFAFRIYPFERHRDGALKFDNV
jgi:hypothetical protein